MSYTLTIPKIKLFGVILQNGNETIYSKYYTKHFSSHFKSKIQYNLDDVKSKRKFEKDLLAKSRRMQTSNSMKEKQTQIFTYQQFTVLFKIVNQLQISFISDDQQNSVLMENLIDCFYEVMRMITQQPFEGKNIFTHLEDLILAIDQMIDEGLIVTLDPKVVFERIKMKEGDGSSSPQKSQPAPQQGSSSGAFSSIFGFAKSSLQKTLNMG